ncbi:CBS domain-containing protein [Sphingobium faniae]|nr:CBS domain-containing protein [Sphingobium faniae]
MTVAAILQNKGHEVVHVTSSESLLSVVKLIAERRIGCVPVVDDGEVVGIFSERDLLYHVAQDGPSALERTVGEVMTTPAITIALDTPIMHSLSLMTKRRIRHLPILTDGALVGLVSIGDLVKYRIDRIESEAAALRDYIQSA